MTRLIVTTDESTAGAIQQAGLADIVIAVERRLVWGQLPFDTEPEAFFAQRSHKAFIGWMTRHLGASKNGVRRTED